MPQKLHHIVTIHGAVTGKVPDDIYQICHSILWRASDELVRVINAGSVKILDDGQILRVPNQGHTGSNGGGRGDLHIRIIVETPADLSAEQLELLKKFNDSLTGKNNKRQQEFAKRAKNFLQGE